MTQYNTFQVTFEHTTDGSDTPRQNRATVTVYGDSEFAIKQAIEKQRPSVRNVIILETEKR